MRRYLYALVYLFLLLSNNSQSQIVSGNAFLKGNYVEVGVGACGTYGTTVDAPVGYHPRGELSFANRLGFVADADKDGWASGTPNYCGDYFVPGTPEEGFGVQVNGLNYNNNLLCNYNQIPGSIVDYRVSGSNILTTWQGLVAGVQISSVTKVPINDVFFITEVTLTNTTANTLSNLFYMRNVDPDNEETITGTYTTSNYVVAQNPNEASRALVSATGLSYGCYLGLGTKDCRARVTWGGFSNRNPADVWNGTGGLSQSGSSTADIAISIAFKIASLAPGESTSFKFAYVLSAADLERALELTEPSLEVNGIPVLNHSTIEVCAGVTVPLQIINGSGFTWSWSPASGLITINGTIVDAIINETTTYTATGVNSCGSTTALTLTLNPSLSSEIGSIGQIEGPNTICLPSSSQVYSVDDVENATLYEWTVPSGVSIVGGDGTSSITVTFSSSFSGNITVKARNGCGVSNTSSLAVSGSVSIVPSINCPDDIIVESDENLCGKNVTFSATGTGSITYSVPSGSFFPVGTTEVTATATTDCGTATCMFKVIVTNDDPNIGLISTVTTPVALGTEISLHVPYTDDNVNNAQIEWGNGAKTIGTINSTDGLITGTYTYPIAGVYTVRVTLFDKCYSSTSTTSSSPATTTYNYVVIYDPSAGFITGGGWITSPPGAYAADPSLTDKANFGFVSKYQKGQTKPSGNTQFQFHAAGMDFKSTSYEWLVISGARGQFKGLGTINGAGDYGFLLSAIDGAVNGGDGIDKFRIKIWDRTLPSGSNIVYDNQMNAAEDADPTTTIEGGSIVIHVPAKGKTTTTTESSVNQREDLTNNSKLSIVALPNPSSGLFTLKAQGGSNESIRVRVLDVLGRVVETRSNISANTTISFGNNYRPGVYYVEVVQGIEMRMLKLVKQ